MFVCMFIGLIHWSWRFGSRSEDAWFWVHCCRRWRLNSLCRAAASSSPLSSTTSCFQVCPASQLLPSSSSLHAAYFIILSIDPSLFPPVFFKVGKKEVGGGGGEFLCVRAMSISSGRLVVPVYNGVWEAELLVVCSAGGHRAGEWMGIAGSEVRKVVGLV